MTDVSQADNPYATALDGLTLEDPVAAFFAFCREREQIRIRRERGDPAPWSDDPVFQRGRFLNTFREDDRVSRALFRFVGEGSLDLPDLVQALFFARWCNRQVTLDALSLGQLEDPSALKHTLETTPDQPWCNVAAYPVEPVRWGGELHSRLDTATHLFAQIKDTLAELLVEAQGDVVAATAAINARFQMGNDFPIFMAVMDVAWFRPDVIDPASPVPTGIGAVPYLDRLQAHLGLATHEATCARMIELQGEHWPDARRSLQPIDVEYLSCECRKYYSYVNGTKRFEGKNVFTPGVSPRLQFDIQGAGPSDVTETHIHVIAGGPCSGKTTLMRALEEHGVRVEAETSERLLQSGVAEGRTAGEVRADPVAWQRELLALDYALFDGLPADERVFTDTSFIEDVVFAARAGLAMGPGVEAWLQRRRYKRVFFLEPLDAYAQTRVRMESQDVAAQISAEVLECYQAYGYEPVKVPAGSVEERLAFVLARSE